MEMKVFVRLEGRQENVATDRDNQVAGLLPVTEWIFIKILNINYLFYKKHTDNYNLQHLYLFDTGLTLYQFSNYKC